MITSAKYPITEVLMLKVGDKKFESPAKANIHQAFLMLRDLLAVDLDDDDAADAAQIVLRYYDLKRRDDAPLAPNSKELTP